MQLWDSFMQYVPFKAITKTCIFISHSLLQGICAKLSEEFVHVCQAWKKMLQIKKDTQEDLEHLATKDYQYNKMIR